MIIPGIHLDALMGVHRGPSVRPLLPVGAATLAAVAQAGFAAAQVSTLVRTHPRAVRKAGLRPLAALSWQLLPGDSDLDTAARKAVDAGYEAATVLVGGNLLDFAEVRRRVDALLEIAHQAGLELHLETHRATLTESLDRTVLLAEAYPELTFNLDFSHWVVTHRLDRVAPHVVVERIQPVLTATRCMHGRVSSGNEIQVPLRGAETLPLFLEIWAAAVAAAPEAVFFICELLSSTTGYARTPETSDRWEDALELVDALQQRLETPA